MSRPIDEKKYEILDLMRQRYATIVAIIDDIKNGKSETEACADQNFDKQLFRIYMNSTRLKTAEGHIITNNEKLQAFLTPYQKLYQDIIGQKLTQDDIRHLPSDFNETMKRLLDELPTKEGQILRLRYFNDWTYDEIIDHTQFSSREHVRQVIERGLRHLRVSKAKTRLHYGDRYIKELNKDRRKETNDRIKALKIKYAQELREHAREILSQYSKNVLIREPYNDMTLEGLITTIRAKIILEPNQYNKQQAIMLLNELVCDIYNDNMIEQLHTSKDIPISNIPGLSLRTKNALHRNGLYQLTDLQTLTIAKLKAMRGAGKATIDELQQVLALYGIRLT